MTTVKRDYAGETATERAARRREALVSAAFALVADSGWRELRMDAVCRGAGLNKRYFYESFADLDALAAGVMQQLTADLIETTLAALDHDADHDTFVREGIGTFVGFLTDDPRRARVLFGAVAPGDAAAGHREAAIREIVSVVSAQGRRRHALAQGLVPEVAAAMLVGGTGQAVLDYLDGRLGSSRAAFVDELAALWQIISLGAAARAS